MKLTTLLFVGSCICGVRSLRFGRGDDVAETAKLPNNPGDATRDRAGRQYDGHIPRQRQSPAENGGQRFVNQFPYKLGRQGQNHGRQTPRQQTQRGLNVPPPNYSHAPQRGGPGPGEGQSRQPPNSAQQNQRPNQPRPQFPFSRGNGPLPNANTPRQSQGPQFPGPDRSASPEQNEYIPGGPTFPNDHSAYEDGQGQPHSNGEGSGSEVPNLPTEDQDGPPRDQEIESQGEDSLQDAQKALNDALQAFIRACQHESEDGQGRNPGQQNPPMISTPPLGIAGMVAAALSNAIQGIGSDNGNNGSAGNPIILPIFIRA